MTTPIKRRTRRSPELWRELLEEQRSSGLTQAAFCEVKAISLASFRNWKRRLAISEPEDSWLELGRLRPDSGSGWEIELDLGHGMCLRLRRG